MPEPGYDAVAAELSAGAEARQRWQRDRFYGFVRGVNEDGTLTVEVGAGWLYSVPALTGYVERRVGDPVLLVNTAAGPLVQGAVGPAVQLPDPVTLEISDAYPPAELAFREVVQGRVWVKPGVIRVMPMVAQPPATSGTVTLTATNLSTYRGGAFFRTSVAAQGDDTGLGLCTGLATFPSWSALTGKTATGGTLTVHRRGAQHGHTSGPVTATAWRCTATGVPSAPPSRLEGSAYVTASLNESVTVPLGAEWCQSYCTGAATAILFWSPSTRDAIELDSVTLSVSF